MQHFAQAKTVIAKFTRPSANSKVVNYHLPTILTLSDGPIPRNPGTDFNRVIIELHICQENSTEYAYSLLWRGYLMAVIRVPETALFRVHPDTIKNDDNELMSSMTEGEACRKVTELAFDALLSGTAELATNESLTPTYDFMKELEKMAQYLSTYIGRDSYSFDANTTSDMDDGDEVFKLRLKISLRANADNHVIWAVRQKAPPFFASLCSMPNMTVRQVLHSFTELYPKKFFNAGVPTVVMERTIIHRFMKEYQYKTMPTIQNHIGAMYLDQLGLLLDNALKDKGIRVNNLRFTDHGRGISADVTDVGSSRDVTVEVMKTSYLNRLMVPETKIPKEEIPTELGTYRLPNYERAVEVMTIAICKVV
jgi:hypothetical protein